MRASAATSSVLWADLLLEATSKTKTATSFVTISPVKEATKRITQDVQENKVIADNTYYYVKSVTDGDTVKVVMSGKMETVRLLGIDTPETKDPRKPIQCFGKEATAHMEKLALNKYVRLESDPTQGDRDKYQRLLRYIYLENGTNVNAEMVRSGFAVAYVRYPVSQIEEYKKLQKTAMESNIGLWSVCR